MALRSPAWALGLCFLTPVPGSPLFLSFSDYEQGGLLSFPLSREPHPKGYSMCRQEVVARG